MTDERRRRRRARLTREQVLRAGLAIADAEGLESLTLRRLAAELGVTPMALYRYVDGKDALLDGLADLVLGDLELPPPEGDWRDGLRAAARSWRRLLVAHPAVVPVVLSRPLFTPAGFRTADAMLGLLRRGGFPSGQAVVLYRQLARFLLALVLLETGAGPRLSEDERLDRARVARITLETLPPERYPHLVEAAPHLAAPFDPEGAFEAGLDLLIGGMERLRG